MNGYVRSPPFRLLDSPAECQDPAQRAVLAQHLRSALPKQLEAALQMHLDRCLACVVLAINAEIVRDASRHYRMSVGPELAKHLELVPVLDPRLGRRDLNWAFVISTRGDRRPRGWFRANRNRRT